MTDELIEAWRKQKWPKRPYIFDKDRALLLGKTHRFASYQDFVTDKAFPDHLKSHFHVGLIPVPFQGSLECADIFICLINPGFGLIDYYAEDLPRFRKTLLRNLKQKVSSDPYPFFSLDPEWHWTGTGKWWNDLLRGIIRELLKKKKAGTYNEAARLVSKRIAALEVVPYHSLNANEVKRFAKGLESSKLVRAYLKNIIEKAKRDEALVVICSGLKMWEVNEKGKNIVHPPKNKGPRARLSMKPHGAGWKILQRLLKRRPVKSLPARCARPGNK